MRYEITVRGNLREWAVPVSEKQAEAMRADGFDVLEVHNSIPLWVADAGIGWLWVYVQDVFDLPSRLFRRVRGK